MSQACPPPPATLPRPRANELWNSRGLGVVRVYSAGGTSGTSWNSFREMGPLGGMRFDPHPLPRAHHPGEGAYYGAGAVATDSGRAGDPLVTAVLERYSDTRVLDRRAGEPWLTVWAPTRPLRLLALSDSPWVSRAGGNAALTSGDRRVSRQWARAIRAACPDLDGLVWSSSVYPVGRSVVLFEPARVALPDRPLLNEPLWQPELQPALARISAEFGLELL